MQFSDCEKLLFCERTFSVPEGPAMPPGKRKAPASTAADGAAPAAGQREERERGFDAKAVKDFLAKIQRPDRLGPNFFNDDERQQLRVP